MNIRDKLQQSLGTAYTLERELGGGGMSHVFLATDTALRRRVVVKVLPPELTAGVNVERFNREILLAAALQYPHIVPVLSAGEMNGLPYFTMPFVEGESLRARLQRGPALSISEAVALLRDVAKALAYAHDHGIVHRDIKPDNVLLTAGSATVADFGIAKAISASRTEPGTETLTQEGTSIGTPAYMAPEQAASDPATDHRADLYSFGCLAYELLTGRPPFVDLSPRKLLMAHMAEAPQAVSQLRAETPALLSDLVMRCLAKDPDDRPQQARELVHVLDTVTTGGGGQPALPAMLIGSSGMMRKALVLYAVAFVVTGIVAEAAIVGIGLPTWVLPGALLLMTLALPAILWTAYVHKVARVAATVTPTLTPGGTPTTRQGAIATMALKATPHTSWRRTSRAIMLAMALFVVVVAGFMTLRALGIGPEGSLLAAGSLQASDRIVMADFDVVGSDSGLGRLASDAMRAGLAQSRVFSLVSATQVGDALRRMEREPGSNVDAPLARAVAQREGAKAVVSGEVTQVGTSLFITVRLVTADSGRELASYRESASEPSELIEIVDQLARRLRTRAGESLRAVNATPPLARVTTASLEALRRYSLGARANDVERDYAAAVRLLREAVGLDSLFAEAWRKLGVAAINLGQPRSVSDSALTAAYRLRSRLGERDRYRVEASYFGYVEPNRPRRLEALQRGLAFGDSSADLNNLAIVLASLRRFEETEQAARAGVRFSPGILVDSRLASTLAALGKWAALDSLRRVRLAEFPGDYRYWSWELEREWLDGDLVSYRRNVDSLVANPDRRYPAEPVFLAATVAYDEGRVRDGERHLREAYRVQSRSGRTLLPFHVSARVLAARIELGLVAESLLTVLNQELGPRPADRYTATDVPFLELAATYARAGQVARAKELLDQYREAVTDAASLVDDGPARHFALSEIALQEERWADAAREIRQADSLPDGPANSCDYCLSLNLVRVFGVAGMADSALSQFEAYRRTTRGSRPRSGPDLLVPAPTMEAVARMYDQRGDTARAIEAYGELVARWERADPELQPRVTAARKRIEALSPGTDRRR